MRRRRHALRQAGVLLERRRGEEEIRELLRDRMHHEIAEFHFVDKSKELSGVVWDCPRLRIWIEGRHDRLEGISGRRDGREIRHLYPTNRHNALVHE